MMSCNPLSFNRRFGGTYRLHRQAMEAISSSETSVETQRTTRRHMTEDDTFRKIVFNVYNFFKNVCLKKTKQAGFL
jgi:hypothetical protein